MTDRELLQQALDALKNAETDGNCEYGVTEALRARLAQPEPNLVAWTVRGLITDFSRDFSAYQTKTYTVPLYTAPPQREWVGLTDADIDDVQYNVDCRLYRDYARAIEAKLREKNT